MYETAKDLEEKEKASQEAKLKKRKLIDTIVVVIIIGIIAAIVYPKLDFSKDKEETKTEQKQEPEQVEKTLSFKKLTTEEKKGSVEITLNGNKHTLSYEKNDAKEERVTKLDDIVLRKDDYGGISDLDYMIVIGADNKEYIIIHNWSYGEIYSFYNEEGKMLKSITNKDKELECEAIPGDSEENEIPVLTATTKNIRYYKYQAGSLNDENSSIKVEEYEVIINNDTITEKPTGKVQEGYISNCEG